MDPQLYIYLAIHAEQNADEASRRTGGCVWVDSSANSARYVSIEEVEPLPLRSRLADMIRTDEQQNFFVLHKERVNVHIFKYPKREAYHRLQLGTLANLDNVKTLPE